MPTGYTEKIKDGITFEEFILTCARAFGACITMREDPLSMAIPDKFEPSKYHVNALTLAKRRLTILNKTTIEQAEKSALVEYNKEKKRVANAIAKDRDLMAKYQEMLHQAKAWMPPTDEHVELKNFMTQQIETSIDHDIGMENNLTLLTTGEEWLQAQRKSIQWGINYHTKELREEIERAEQRTGWIKALRNSLLCDQLGTPVCDVCEKRFRCFTIRNYKNGS